MALGIISSTILLAGKFVLSAYHEEKIANFIDTQIKRVENLEIPEGRKKYWINRLTGLKEVMPKKKFIDDTLQYSQEEVTLFLNNLKETITELAQEFRKELSSLAGSIAKNINDLISRDNNKDS